MPTILDEHQPWYSDGKPLVGGKAYFGVQGADPKISPQDIFSDRDFATPISNPQTLDAEGRTANKVWIKDRYSILVEDLNGVQKYQELDNGEPGSVGIVTLDNVIGANVISATASPTITSYVDKETYVFKTVSINTGAVTLDIDGVGAKSVTLSDGSALVSGQWAANQNVKVIYNVTSDTFVFEQFRELSQAELEAGTGVIPGVVSGLGVAQAIAALESGLPRSYLAGIGLSNAADTDHDITFSVGEARDSTNASDLSLTSAQTKQIDVTWATGDAAGGLASGVTLSADTWYHCFVGLVGSTVECGFDSSLTAANLVANNAWTVFRRVGAVLTDASSNILGFTQAGDWFIWDNPPEDINDTNISTAGENFAMSSPLGVRCWVHYNHQAVTTDVSFVYFSSPDADNEAPSDSAAPLNQQQGSRSAQGQLATWTNTSSEIRLRAAAANQNVIAATLYYMDTRGRDD